MGITWQDNVANNVVPETAGVPSLYTLKAKADAMAGTCDTGGRRSHSKGFSYGELATGKIPQLRFKDVCKHDLQALGLNTDSLEVAATDRAAWRHTVKLRL